MLFHLIFRYVEVILPYFSPGADVITMADALTVVPAIAEIWKPQRNKFEGKDGEFNLVQINKI